MKAKVIKTTESEYVERMIGGSYWLMATATIETEDGKTHTFNRGSLQCPFLVAEGDEGIVNWADLGAFSGPVFRKEMVNEG